MELAQIISFPKFISKAEKQKAFKRYDKQFEDLYDDVRAYYHNKCAECESGDRLGIHHIDLDHVNMARENLILLCWPCHMKKHHVRHPSRNSYPREKDIKIAVVPVLVQDQSSIEEKLEILGWTQKDLIARIEVNKTTVSRWMTGKARIPKIVLLYLDLIIKIKDLSK